MSGSTRPSSSRGPTSTCPGGSSRRRSRAISRTAGPSSARRGSSTATSPTTPPGRSSGAGATGRESRHAGHPDPGARRARGPVRRASRGPLERLAGGPGGPGCGSPAPLGRRVPATRARRGRSTQRTTDPARAARQHERLSSPDPRAWLRVRRRRSISLAKDGPCSAQFAQGPKNHRLAGRVTASGSPTRCPKPERSLTNTS